MREITMLEQSDEAKAPDLTPLEGKEAANADTILGLYQVGNFRYQFIKSNGKRTRIMRCCDPATRDNLVQAVNSGTRVLVEDPTAKKAG